MFESKSQFRSIVKCIFCPIWNSFFFQEILSKIMRTWHFYFFLLLYFSDFSIAICKWIVKRYLTFFGSFCEFCLVSEISKKNLQLFTCTPHENISYLFHEFSMYKNIQSSRGKKFCNFFAEFVPLRIKVLTFM